MQRRNQKLLNVKLINQEELNEEIIKHEQYITALTQTDPDEISQTLQRIITETLDSICPIRKKTRKTIKRIK